MKKMKMLVQTTLNDVVRLNAGSGRRMNGKTVLAIVIVFLLLGAGVVNSTRYITSTSDSALYANKWNATTSQFNNSKSWWGSWNASSGAGSSITAADRAKWNATNKSVQRFQSQWNSSSGSGTTYPGKWNLTTTQFNNSKLFWILWNATRTGLIGWGHNWNNTMQKLNNSQSFWTKWNVTNSSVQRFQSQWNATSGGGSYAPNVTYIVNSKGNKFSVNESSLQQAIYDLNSTSGGWVELPKCNITISNVSSGLTMTSNVWLRGAGYRSIIYLKKMVNKTVFKNYDSTNGNTNIRISDIRIEGNGLQQPEWYHVGAGAWAQYAYGIYFTKVSGVQIEDCLINNTACGGILLYQSNNVTVESNTISFSGKLYEDSGHNYANWQANGCYPFNCSNVLISDNSFIDPFDCGVVVESGLDCPYRWRDYLVIVSGNTITKANSGIYSEDSRDCLFDSNLILNGDNETAFGTCVGFYLSNNCKFLHISDSVVTRCAYGVQTANTTDFNGVVFKNVRVNRPFVYGFWINAGFVTLEGCDVYNSSSTSFFFDRGANNCTIRNSNSYDSFSVGISRGYGAASHNISFFVAEACCIYRSVSYGIISYVSNTTISGCVFRGCGSSTYTIYMYLGTNCTVKGCDLRDNFNEGIAFRGVSYGQIENNYVQGAGSGDAGIYLKDCRQIMVQSNYVVGRGTNYPQYGIQEATSAYKNEIINNKFVGVGTGIVRIGSDSVVRGNEGYMTESWGTFSIAAGASRGTASSNMSCLPNCVYITPMGNTSCSSGLKYGFNATYTGTGGTYIVRIMVPGKLDNTCTFSWYACNVTGGTRHNN